MNIRKPLPECPIKLELSLDELDSLQDALQAFILQPRKFSDPSLRELLARLDLARSRLLATTSKRKNTIDAAKNSSDCYPLLAWAETSPEANTLPITYTVRAFLDPRSLPGEENAPRRKRAANRKKAVTAEAT